MISVGFDKQCEQHSRLGRPFLIYESSLQQEVLLPPEHVKWFATQTDGLLSSAEIRMERHAIRYLHAGVPFGPSSQFIEKVLRESLTRNLPAIQGPVYEEVERSISRVFGATETDEWRTLNLYEAVQDMTFPAMSRVFFGLQLSRNENLLRSFKLYCAAMGLGTVVVGQLPRVLKRVVVPIFNLPLWYFRRKTLSYLTPAIERVHTGSESGPESKCHDTYDFFQQCVQTSAKLSGAHNNVDSATLAEYVMVVVRNPSFSFPPYIYIYGNIYCIIIANLHQLKCFTGLLSQVTQTSNLILDLATCSPEKHLLQSLREEVTAVIRNEQDWKNPDIFKNSLPLADSTIRESLRCHPILIKGLTKEVVSPKGVELPDGTQMAQGSWLGIPVLGIHMDERFYNDPKVFNPFRFVGPPKEEKLEPAEQIAAARPTNIYFGFGYGRHAW